MLFSVRRVRRTHSSLRKGSRNAESGPACHSELANYIQIHGGIVSSVLVLANAGRLNNLIPSQSVIRKIQSRYDYEIEQILGIHAATLTANEANYLIGFRTTDKIRNRLAKAREETDRRIRSKGIAR